MLVDELGVKINEYERKLTDDNIDYSLSVSNRLVTDLLTDLKNIEKHFRLKLIYSEVEVKTKIRSSFTGSLNRFFSSIKEDLKNEDQQLVKDKIISIDKNKNLVDVCHQNPNSNRISNELDYYLYKNNKNNLDYRAVRHELKKKLSNQVSKTTLNYIVDVQTEMFELIEETIHDKNGMKLENTMVLKIPGRSNLYSNEE